MPDILHRVGVKATPDAVYAALTSINGLAGWWTSDTRGDAAKNGVIQFRFGESRTDVRVLEAKPNANVVWEVLDAHADWIGTTLRFELKQKDDVTFILFKHEGWKAPTDFMHHCSTKWAVFLVSLKAMLETGEGRPFPHDTQIAA